MTALLPNGMQEHTVSFMKNQKLILPTKYQPQRKLGSGSYGIVVCVKDQSGEKFAVKRCGNVFTHCKMERVSSAKSK